MASLNPGFLPVAVPEDVLAIIRRIFASGNEHVSKLLSRQPMSREDHLDQSLISFLDYQSPEVAPQSGWIVDCETHFLGNGRHSGRWEIADIGVIVNLRHGGQSFWSKVAVLQSKRLFPLGTVHDEEAERERYRRGLGRLAAPRGTAAQSRTFMFAETSKYASLDLRRQQASRIDLYEGEMTIPVHYMLYNPAQIPWSRTLPTTAPIEVPENDVGCRIVRSRDVFALRGRLNVPTYADMLALAPPHAHAHFAAGWRLEDFVVSLLLGCHEGKVLDSSVDAAMEFLFYRHTGPIAAAFAINIETSG